MNHEIPKKRKDVPVAELSYIDFTLITQAEMYDLLHDLAEENGIKAEDALYVGIDADDGNPLQDGFGERETTWAFTDKEYRDSLNNDRLTGDYSSSSPIFYAVKSSYQPLVMIFDGTMFDNAMGQTRLEIEDGMNDMHADLEYRIKPGMKFDDAIVAALRIEM